MNDNNNVSSKNEINRNRKLIDNKFRWLQVKCTLLHEADWWLICFSEEAERKEKRETRGAISFRFPSILLSFCFSFSHLKLSRVSRTRGKKVSLLPKKVLYIKATRKTYFDGWFPGE